MDEKEANIRGLLNLLNRMSKKSLNEELGFGEELDTELRRRQPEIFEVLDKHVELISERFSAQEVEQLMNLVETPLGEKVVFTIPLLYFYAFQGLAQPVAE